MKLACVAALVAALALAGCNPAATPPMPRSGLPQLPPDIQQCFKRSGVNVPDRDLTVAEVEALWKQDRLRIVVMRNCGTRVVLWYNDLRKRWR